ncbi:hypothetical protein LMG28688_00792 [Paraburkholderia caffeinitolerans]|uniref:HTH marR-type domain-containing protein n=1 Tax=Paraburkholderia caffeinitolerans TaxID=1723730 RepID=A0A6J5FIT3_9BURK|nr:winged helix-turn-helix domain-containing protein [Paraburkholderia caffeinitolerans]CAB3779290.1 hypothetical protein LMG28688_00792 [Paraburkholderia caffeinitolerans]
MIASTSVDSLIAHKESGKAAGQRLAILNHLRADPSRAMSRNEIARHFDMPIQSVCGRVGELKDDGLVVEDLPKLDAGTDRMVKPVRAAPDLFAGQR